MTHRSDTGSCGGFFGLCPECCAEPDFRNIRRTHVAYCEKCRTKWTVGANLFSSWRSETEADWKENAIFLADFREAMPAPPPEEAEVPANEEKPRRKAAERVQVVQGSGGWYVVAIPGRYADTDGDCVDIIHGPLESNEAAECARNDAILSIQDCGSPCVGSVVPAEVWNLHGRLLRFLRQHNGRTTEELANEMARQKPWEKYDSNPFPNDFPF